MPCFFPWKFIKGLPQCAQHLHLHHPQPPCTHTEPLSHRQEPLLGGEDPRVDPPPQDFTEVGILGCFLTNMNDEATRWCTSSEVTVTPPQDLVIL